MKRRLNVSPTQVETHAHVCPRKRYIKNVLKVREPQGTGAAVGDACHDVIYDLLMDFKEPRGDQVVRYEKNGQEILKFPGQIVQNARKFLPQPGTVIAEGGVEVNTPAATWWLKVDWVRLAQHGLLLGDNKTTSNPIYAMDSSELLQDIQSNQYANAIFTSPKFQARLGLTAPPQVVPVRWVYMLTDDEPRKPRGSWVTDEAKRKWSAWEQAGKPLAWAVEALLYPHHVAGRIARFDQIVEEMAAFEAAAGGDPMKVPGNPDGCSAFGGCKFQGTAHCKLSVDDMYARVYSLADNVEPSTPPTHVFEQTQPGDQTMSTQPPLPAMPPQMLTALQNAQNAQNALAAANPSAVLPPPPALTPPAPTPPAPVQISATVQISAPPHWLPGDPLTGFQPQFLGKPLLIVASAALESPPQAVILSWPGVNEPYSFDPSNPDVNAMQHPAIKARMAGQLAIAAPVAAPPAPSFPGEANVGTPVGVPEHGRINSPEGSPVAARNPEELQAQHEANQAKLPPVPAGVQAAVTAPVEPTHDTPPHLEGAHRDALKEACIREGALDPNTGKPIDKSSRLGIPKLKEALDNVTIARLRANGGQPPAPTPPEPAPVMSHSAFVSGLATAAPVAVPPGYQYASPTDARRPDERHGLVPVATMAPNAELSALADAFESASRILRRMAGG